MSTPENTMMHLADIDTAPSTLEGFDPTTPVLIAHGGERRWATAETWGAVADELVAKHGPGVPKVTDYSRAPAPDVKPGATIDPVDDTSPILILDAQDTGFAPPTAIFRRGVKATEREARGNRGGRDHVARSRVAHDALPGVRAACNEFETAIMAERRADEVVNLGELRMTSTGKIAHGVDLFNLTERAFETLAGPHTGIGGAAYLTRCPPALRATNVNHWLTKIGQDEIRTRNVLEGSALAAWKPKAVRLRTRTSNSTVTPREVFGIVSAQRYTAFDVDRVAQALTRSMPDGAKCRITYDGEGAIFDVEFHTKKEPKDFVVGEFFRTGFRVRTDDTGGGSIIGDTFVTQNLCLNLMLISRVNTPIFRLRHTGSVHELAKRFADGMAEGLASIDHFLKAWDYAANDERVLPFDESVDVPDLRSVRELLPGIFNGIMERELVPVRGRREETIPLLMRMFEEDTSYAAHAHESVTRGAVVNAFTRYAHTVEQDDFATDAIERSVSGLLYGRGNAPPAPLPYLPLAR